MSILFIILATIYIAKINQKEYYKMLPVVLLSTMMGVYLFAIIGLLKAIPYISGVMCIILVILFIKNKSKLKNSKPYGKTSMLILGIVAVMLIICFWGHLIIFSDDFGYYAVFPKTLYSLNKLPDISNTTYTPYNSYSPITGLLYYFVMKGFGFWHDGIMFIVNHLFYYVLCLPLLGNIKDKPSKQDYVRVIIYLIFPFAVQDFSYTTLGVDMAVACTFGFVLYAMLDNEVKDFFYYYRIAISLAVLVLIKTPAILFACILALVFIINERKSLKFIKSLGVLIVAIAVPYGSWNLWCLLHGMHDYLTVGIICNIRDVLMHSGVSVPTYLWNTVASYMRGLFTQPMTGTSLGFSVIAWLAIIFIFFYLLRQMGAVRKEEKITFVSLMIGFVIYCICHIYMYLFIFASNEAATLSAFGRYLMMYMVPLLYFIVICLNRKKSGLRYAYYVILVLLLLNLNYPQFYQYVLPVQYRENCESEIQTREQVIEVLSESEANGSGDMLIISSLDAKNVHLYAGNIKYEALPQPSINATAGENEKILKLLETEKISDISFVGVTEQERSSIQKTMQELGKNDVNYITFIP